MQNSIVEHESEQLLAEEKGYIRQGTATIDKALAWTKKGHYLLLLLLRHATTRRVLNRMHVLLPSFLQRSTGTQPRSKNNISALDGLRGLSCLMVFNAHWTFVFVHSYRDGSGEMNTTWLFHRPLFHLFWGGAAQVDIFFVLSGYVLSVRCLNQIHAHAWSDFHKTLASAVFRRAIRIFLPPLVTLVIYLFAIEIGMFNKSTEIYMDTLLYRNMQIEIKEPPPPILKTFKAQLIDILGAMMSLLDPSSYLKITPFKKYNPHLWTIPKEYYCSMALYVVLLGTSRLRPSFRVCGHVALVVFCLMTFHRNHALFFAGMTIAELDLLWKKRLVQQAQSLPAAISLPISEKMYPIRSLPRPMRLFRILTFIPWITYVRVAMFSAGVYFLSTPGLWGDTTDGYRIWFKIKPNYLNNDAFQHLMRAFGAILLVWPISNVSISTPPTSAPLSGPVSPAGFINQLSFYNLINLVLSNPVSAYLGRVSYSLYLLHGLFIKSLGYRVLPLLYHIVIPSAARREFLKGWRDKQWNGTKFIALSKTELEWGKGRCLTTMEVALLFGLGYIIVLPVTIWVSDLFMRAVDERCVTLGRKVEGWISVGNDEPVHNKPHPVDQGAQNVLSTVGSSEQAEGSDKSSRRSDSVESIHLSPLTRSSHGSGDEKSTKKMEQMKQS